MTNFFSRLTIPAILAAAVTFGTANAADRGSLDEAKALAQKAAAFMKTNIATPQKALDSFQNDPSWQDRDLYVTVRTKDGTSVAHPKQPAMVGKNQIDLKDVDGKPLVREIVACQAECWVEYKWKNHATGAIEAKSSYVVAVGDYRVLVGAYKP
ncbi:MAG TPA: cache domain-containing protein [Magnetospirillum sp.]|nr:cache domain-containing protein [Magnetospirillum sp.]